MKSSHPIFAPIRRVLLGSVCAGALLAFGVASPASAAVVKTGPATSTPPPADNGAPDPANPRRPAAPIHRLPQVTGPGSPAAPTRTITRTPVPGDGHIGNRPPYGLGTGLPGQSKPIHLPLPRVTNDPPAFPRQQTPPQQRIVTVPWWYWNGWGADVWSTGSGDGRYDPNSNNNNGQPLPPMLPPIPPPPGAQAQIEAAEGTMAQVRTRIQNALLASPAWRTANAAVAQAQADLDAATIRAKDELATHPEYSALLARKQQIAAEIARIHRTVKEPSIELLTPLATQDMQTGAALNRMEAKLKAQDPRVADARARLIAAQAQVDGMKKQVDADVTADPTWQAAQLKLQAARQHLAAGQ